MAQDRQAQSRNSDRAPENMPTSFGFQSVGEGQKQALVDDVFHKVADRYDVMNDLMSGGLHRLWKDAMVSVLAPPKSKARPWRLLDVAGGTGDIATRAVRKSGEQIEVVVCDINESMLGVGRERAAKAGLTDQIEFTQGNAEDLPFPDKSFDAYTIAFGIRNVPDIPKALSEARRVLKRGGKFLCLEFSDVDVPGLDKVYDAFSFNVIPPMGRLVTGDGDPYRYLVESIRNFPHQDRFAEMIRDAGFERVSYRNYSGGIAALHSGWKY
ncbi:demethylmenaquinone methyltransferase/2-methoxy-6-polyprenyl-1,4-benzoquinol methylase [Roseibium hamelinense]|uniref:Ubiquinone/menaquinone biosynthesis C-methyltransferase UbiE n=1 Tax=Roseibium hamelinense TaxID=150831 RepID=A0A562T128_9HYPH|nr:bifunctional demethylmenaquinone methyltransferase/2-methoxy-6-polyprenyl-1,4-benzoquinol methylase UbiE [Roseibium hamelinense]MTI44690.1 bifunctional demethylmenaquinone methyltransferase/2-methoxy-6-polyprenyl-1,4-benzoquinol methylase UbiE [Roseibium hamelinense]TWI87319.1 demethylmenaquinone methyltransferase/2-methoxy-6-polyprenyl-1,4-benzoquinol methylase [Roseibium hamelinense]